MSAVSRGELSRVLPSDLSEPRYAESAVDVLTWAVDEMEERRKRILDLARKSPSPQGVKATDLYRVALSEESAPEITPLILVIDEFADIMLAGKRSAEKFEDLEHIQAFPIP